MEDIKRDLELYEKTNCLCGDNKHKGWLDECGGVMICENCDIDGYNPMITIDFCDKCGKQESDSWLLHFCNGCQKGKNGKGGFCPDCRVSDWDENTDICNDCFRNGGTS
jgi:hypothetical protein